MYSISTLKHICKMLGALSVSLASLASLGLEAVSDQALGSVVGQRVESETDSGVQLSGSFTFNSTQLTEGSITSSSCENAASDYCGTDLMVQFRPNAGWLGLGQLQGKVTFADMNISLDQMSLENIDGEEIALAGKTLLSIALPKSLSFEGFQFDVSSRNAELRAHPYLEHDLFSIAVEGSIHQSGRILMFAQ